MDLVLTDLVMPGGLTGMALIESLREQRADLPAVLMSGYNFEVERHGHPPIGFLQKPFDLKTLAAALRTVLAR